MQSDGFWVMVIKDIPVGTPPPRMGIFWATPWPDKEAFESQVKRFAKWHYTFSDDMTTEDKLLNGDEDCFYDHFGKEPNWNKTVRIRYDNQDIRLFAHEFSVTTKENMDIYLNEDGAYELRPYDIQGDMLMSFLLNKEFLPTYEAALLDGCPPNLAQLVALGQDFDVEYPPVGYYEPHPELVAMFRQ